MRFAVAICCAGMLVLAGGCTKFTGEWIEQSRVTPKGEVINSTGPRRMALRFEPICTVRAGSYVDAPGVVDFEAETYDTYLTMKNGNTAQFGATIARLDGDHLTTYVGAQESRRFTRNRGPSVFPPRLYARSTEGN